MIAVETRKKRSNWQGRIGALTLAVLLLCPLLGSVASAAPSLGTFVVAQQAAPKPTVSVTGNVVVDKNKATGFYELSLRVKTARKIADASGNPVTEEAYAQVLADDKANSTNVAAGYTITNYPFLSASAAVHVNLDALTAVTWGAGKPIYTEWDAGTNKYSGETAFTYPRGIDAANADQPQIFTDLTALINGTATSIRMESARPDEITNATALLEDYDPATNTALLTLTANTTTTRNVVYSEETPVVVVRFAYDLNRFQNTDVSVNTTDFALPMDAADNAVAAKTNLTYLGKKETTNPFETSDQQAADSSVHQTVWYRQNLKSDQVSEEPTEFYYYLGADNCNHEPDKQKVNIVDTTGGAFATSEEELYLPSTSGTAVLAKKDAAYPIANDPDAGEATPPAYSFFQNLLKLDDTLKLRLVNEETYRKPTGGGGTTILFYDWDDKLIGSLVVDKGDVRAEVEAYVEENLVHPDLRPGDTLQAMGGKVPDYTTNPSDANSVRYQNLTNSLAREYTYRGKYAYTVGGDDTTQGRADGADYPLTNKLDYVFTKRVNTALERDGNRYMKPHNVTEADMADAALYPYVYGWAVVEDSSAKNKNNWKVMYDATKIEDTWTTIGVGELAGVDPDATTKIIPPATAPTATDTYAGPSFLDETKLAALTPNYTYQLTADGAESYFRFADFSDIDAELARYAKKSGGAKDTLIVKAVYEPGDALLSEYYRMITEPAFSKYNIKTADAGGAYKVQMMLERSYDNKGDIQGVVRVREPVIQMDTTTDAKWITSDDPEVKNDLNNPSYNVSLSRTETTYTRVDVDNGEQIQFGLSLSARMNKVDYMLVEMFDSNFIAGTQRSYTNNDQKTLNPDYFIPDNYNYYLNGDSDETDDYYDCDFATRNGSRGFALSCTLGHMLEQATLRNNNEINQATYNNTVTYSIAKDINLCMDLNGTQPKYADEASLQQVFLAAARACENHKKDPDYDCWDENLDCAKLTYHQIQWFLLDGSTDIRTVAAADADKLNFCHYHASCAAAMSTVPKTWDEVIQAARDNKADDLKKMTLTSIENLTHLRADQSGKAFATPNAFADKIIAAVGAGKTSWVDIQAHIIGSGNVDTFWWYDGSTTNPAPTSFSALYEAAKPALNDQTYPDGSTHKTLSKFNAAQAAFDKNAAAGDGKTDPAWVKMTHNLVKAHAETTVGTGEDAETTYTTTKFTDFTEFRTAYLDAVKTVADPTNWQEVQLAILEQFNPGDTGGDPAYWWKDGKTPLKVTNVKTLLQAAQLANSSDTAEQTLGNEALAKLTLTDLAGDPYYLRSSQKGDLLSDKYIDNLAILTAVKAAQKAGATEWNSLQYYLIHQVIAPDPNVMNREAAYYWWKNGGDGTDLDFSTVTTLNDALRLLQEAALRGSDFGDPKAKYSVEAQKGADGSFYALTHLTTKDPTTMTPPAETVTGMEWYTDTQTLLDKMSDLMKFMQEKQGVTDPFTIPSVDWYQAQYWILTGEYLTIPSAELDAAIKSYWWYDQTEKPAPPPARDPHPSDPLIELIKNALDGTITDDELKAAVTEDELNTWHIFTPWDYTFADAGALETAQEAVVALKDELAGSYDGSTLTLSWAETAFYIGGYYDGNPNLYGEEDAMNEILWNWGWVKEGDDGDYPYIPAQFDLSGYGY